MRSIDDDDNDDDDNDDDDAGDDGDDGDGAYSLCPHTPSYNICRQDYHIFFSKMVLKIIFDLD